MIKKILKAVDMQLKFGHLLWLIPVLLSVHNTEEALTMPQWVSENRGQISSVLPVRIDFSKSQLLASLASATIVPFCITAVCVGGARGSFRIKILLGLQAIVFMNALIPHIVLTLWLMKYNPGFVTAVLFNIPFSIYLFHRAVKEGYTTRKNLTQIFVASFLLYPAVAYLNHVIGEIAVKIL
jgi:Protein of unknown function with HXXEE motif